MKKRVFALFTAMFLLCGMLAGCGPTGSSSTTTDGSDDGAKDTLIVAIPESPTYMDPMVQASIGTYRVTTQMFDRLVMMDNDMNLVPGLAESWEVIDDTTTVFHLRQGVKFHNGEEMTSEDVKYSLERCIANPGVNYNYLIIESITCDDDYTVTIKTSAPFNALLYRLSLDAASIICKSADTSAEEFNKNPVGTGPFKFVSWEKDQKVVLEKNPDYYGEVPQIDQLVFRVIPEAADRVAALQAGEVDIICNIPTTQAEYLESLDGISVVGQPSTRVVWLQFNLVGGPTPLDDVRVRQAINYAVDRDALIAGVLDGYAVKVASISTPEYEGYDPNVQGYTYDVEKAKQLMADAGYADGFDIECSVSPGLLNSTDVVQAIASQLAQIGINVTIKQEDSATQRDEIGAGTVAPLFLQGLGGPYCDINLIASIGFTEGARYCTWVSPEFMDLASQAASEMDAEKRVALYSQMQQMMVDEAPALWLYQQDTLYAYNSKKVQNWTARTDEVVLMDGVSVAG